MFTLFGWRSEISRSFGRITVQFMWHSSFCLLTGSKDEGRCALKGQTHSQTHGSALNLAPLFEFFNKRGSVAAVFHWLYFLLL